jgi:hypothetical protein
LSTQDNKTIIQLDDFLPRGVASPCYDPSNRFWQRRFYRLLEGATPSWVTTPIRKRSYLYPHKVEVFSSTLNIGTIVEDGRDQKPSDNWDIVLLDYLCD